MIVHRWLPVHHSDDAILHSDENPLDALPSLARLFNYYLQLDFEDLPQPPRHGLLEL